MSPQTALPLHALAPFSDRDTSLAAAREMAAHVQRCEGIVLDALRAHGGLTQDALTERTGLGGDTVRPRLDALKRRGFVVQTDEKRATRSGRAARVWRIA